jgi:hypothetical protein
MLWVGTRRGKFLCLIYNNAATLNVFIEIGNHVTKLSTQFENLVICFPEQEAHFHYFVALFGETNSLL